MSKESDPMFIFPEESYQRVQEIAIPYNFASLNALITKGERHWGYRAKWKKEMHEILVPIMKEQLQPVKKYPIETAFYFFFKHNRSRDIDNMGLAVKALHDSLYLSGIITEDSIKYIMGYRVRGAIGAKFDGVHLFIIEPNIQIHNF